MIDQGLQYVLSDGVLVGQDTSNSSHTQGLTRIRKNTWCAYNCLIPALLRLQLVRTRLVYVSPIT